MLFGMGPLELVGILIFVILLFFLPKIMRARILSSITKLTLDMESIVKDARDILIKISKEQGTPSQDPGPAVDNFIEFFVVPPVSLDPQGIVQKFDKILELGEERFKDMIEVIAPMASEEEKSNMVMTLKATIGLNSITKLVRHNLELAKKTGNLQILLALQMNIPLIMRLVKAQFEGVKSFSKCHPIGDGIGPLVASLMMKGCKEENLEYQDDMIVLHKKYQDRNLTILRAKGPGGRVGKVGKVAADFIDKDSIDRVITVDAAAKLEGEETGKVAEGIGVVIGGLGTEKWFIEEKIVSNELKIDAIIVKMSPEEAISQMTKEILDSSGNALKTLENSIKRSPEGSNILIVGVGNSCGIPNINIDPAQIKIKKIKDSKNNQE